MTMLAAMVLATVVLGSVMGASAVWCRSLWGDRPVLAPVFGLLGLAAVAQVMWVAYWIDRGLGIAASFTVVLVSLISLVAARPWRSWRGWLPVVALTLGAGCVALGAGFLYGGTGDPFVTLAARYRVEPNDNILQHLFADRLWNDEATVNLIGDWHGSDRPPLQSGLLLLARPFSACLGWFPDAQVFDPKVLAVAAAASVLAQLVWVPTTYALLRVLGFRQRTVALVITFTSISQVMFHNETFTWPKLLAAGLTIGAVALLADLAVTRRWRPSLFVSAVALAVLSFLAHGTTAFVAPLLGGLAFLVLRGVPQKAALRALLAAGGAAVLTYLPWQLYGTFADPFTGRLLKWHLAGMIAPNDMSVWSALRRAYTTTPVHELLHNRAVNLQTVFHVDVVRHQPRGEGWLVLLRNQDFFHTTWTLGWGCLLTVLMLGQSARDRRAASGRHRRDRGSARSRRQEVIARWIVVLSIASLLFWTLVMFEPGAAVVHQGSLVWVVLLLAVPAAWAFERSRVLGAVVVTTTAAYSAAVWLPPNPDGLHGISAPGLSVLLLGVLLLAACVLWVPAAGPASGESPLGGAADPPGTDRSGGLARADRG
jgi:hypothetical protein